MINKGNPINPKELLDIVSSKFNTILTNIVNFIPLGFNELYTVTGTKSFSIRPKVSNPVYSARSGSVQFEYLADTSQPNIGVAYYGTPWTQELATNFGVTNNFDYNLGSKREPFPKYTNKLSINPATDIVGGVPFRGNSPFINNGFIGMSNGFEDQNLRLYVDTSGTTLTFKAAQVSVLSRGTNYDIGTAVGGFVYVGDSEIQRFNLEMKTLKDIDLSTTSVGHIPDITGYEGDLVLWLVRNELYDTTELKLTTIDDLYKLDSYPIIDHPALQSEDYVRPLYIIRHEAFTNDLMGTDYFFNLSNVYAWGESASDNTNGDTKFTKLYQQSSGADTTLQIQTIEEDRRAIPAWYYLDNDNSFIVEKTNYSGLIRHIPGAGASKVKIKRESYPISSTVEDNDNVPVTIEIGSIELTNGVTSIWVKDLNITTTNGGLYSALSFETSTSRGLYLWLLADPLSIAVSNIGSSYSPTYRNLRMILIASGSPTWDAIDGNFGMSAFAAAYPEYTHRCRIGYLPPSAITGITTGTSEPFVAYDGDYYFPNLNYYSTITNQHNCIGTGVTDGLNLFHTDALRSLPQYGISVSGTRGTCSAAKEILTMNVMSSGTAVGTTLATGTGAQWAGIVPSSAMSSTTTKDDYLLKVFNFEGKQTTLVEHKRIGLLKNDSLYYMGTGADGGAALNYRLKSSWLKGFYLPFDYR